MQLISVCLNMFVPIYGSKSKISLVPHIWLSLLNVFVLNISYLCITQDRICTTILRNYEIPLEPFVKFYIRYWTFIWWQVIAKLVFLFIGFCEFSSLCWWWVIQVMSIKEKPFRLNYSFCLIMGQILVCLQNNFDHLFLHGQHSRYWLCIRVYACYIHAQ
jgi:hypothetical protein